MDSPGAAPTSAPAPSSSPAPSAPSSTPAPATTAASTGAPGNTSAPARDIGGPLPQKTPPQPPPTTPEAEIKKEIERRKYKLKVDGQDIEQELSDDEITVRLQKAAAAEKRFQEAAEVRKNVQRLFEQLKNDPLNVLKDPVFGVDVRKMVEDELLREYQESQLPEHERGRLEEVRKRESLEKELNALKAEKEAQQRAALEQRIFQETEKAFGEALEGEALPRSRRTMAMMAEVAAAALDQGYELTPQQLASAVNEQLREQTQHVLKGLKGERLAAYLGDEAVKELLRYSVDKVRKAPAAPSPDLPREPAPNPAQNQFLDDEKPKPPRKTPDYKAVEKSLRGW